MNSVVRVQVNKVGLGKVKRLTDEVADIHYRTAQVIASIAAQLVPVDTGNLKSTIAIEQEGGTRFGVVAGGSQAEYAYFIEFGTEFQSAQPFMRPAAVNGRKWRDEQLQRLAARFR